MEIFVPNSAFLGNIESFTSKYKNNSEKLNISFHSKWVSVHPSVLAMTACAGLYYKHLGKKVNVDTNSVITTKSLPYLLRIGLFNILDAKINVSVVEHESSGRFIPLTQIKSSNDLHEFITDMIPLLHASVQEVEPIKYVISELVNNVLEHSKSPVGAIVCAQYFPKKSRVSIGVADAGIGIKKSMEKNHYVPTDIDAILLAMKPGITGTTHKFGGTELNAGAGLFFTKSIAKTSRNFFYIYSGNGSFKLRKTPKNEKIKLFVDPKQDLSTVKYSQSFWNGTVVGIDFSVDQHFIFSNLLKVIKKNYFKEIKDKKKQKYKRAKFS